MQHFKLLLVKQEMYAALLLLLLLLVQCVFAVFRNLSRRRCIFHMSFSWRGGELRLVGRRAEAGGEAS